MTTETLTVPEIHCGHCKSSIEGALRALPGVERAMVDVEGRTVDVAFDEARVELSAIVEAIEAQGYQVPAQE